MEKSKRDTIQRLCVGIEHLTLSPHEEAARHIIEHRACDRARQACEPPYLTVGINDPRDANIGDETNAAAQRKENKANKKLQTMQTPVAIGELIVQNEIARHRDQSCSRLCTIKSE